VAAQLMVGQGFDEVYNLKGGIMAWQGLTAVGPAEVGMALIRGDESVSDMIVLAYGMEEGLRGFYEVTAENAGDQEVREMFLKLAAIERRHQERLFQVYTVMDGSVSDMKSFEKKVVTKAMEGGLTPKEFLAKNQPVLQTIQQVLEVAMMIEAQALDLYLRYSQKSKEEKTRTVLFDIAEEEKAHLAALGRLLDEKGRG
jgi:rubrerythrin